MTYSLTWLPDVLLAAGLKVSEVSGWRSRGHGDMGIVRGVLCHHTATASLVGNYPSLGVVTNGRADLPGPLCNVGLGRDGTWYIVAAGSAWHAGPGSWQGVTKGNTQLIGIEAENPGTKGSVWPEVQKISFAHGCAAMLKYLGENPIMCAGHKEFAHPPGRKIDPNFDMGAFRREVALIMGGIAPAPSVVPSVDGTGRPTLKRGMKGDLVILVQKKLKIEADGDYGPHTEAAVRQFQRDNPPLVPDGRVGPKTWAALDAKP